ncbi:MAG: hypothetical protein HY200_04730 [Nitrospirae bacterium]|nr:hypothetical protein [Nitrospirota bacterium]
MMPTIQISQSKIDRIIRPILGQYYGSEDSYQDVHVKILELSPQSEEEIKAIALEVKKKHIRDFLHKKFSEKSLYEPIESQGDEKFTFESILADKETEVEPESLSMEPAAKSILNFLIKEMVDGKSLNWSILSLLRKSSELLKRHHRRWEKWEEDILRENYIRGGSLAVALFLNRTVNAITSRVFYLGIRRYPQQFQITKEYSNVQGENVIKREQLKKRSTRNSDHKRLESLRVKKEKLRLEEKEGLKRKRKLKHTR